MQPSVHWHERFFLRTLDATAPLLLWALHFFVAYIFVAMSCDTGWVDLIWRGSPAIRLLLVAWTMAMLALDLWLLLRAIVRYRNAPPGLQAGARVGCAVLGTIGIAWTAVPMFVLSACTK